jgi:DNA-binding NarL/FixJ family response regulator
MDTGPRIIVIDHHRSTRTVLRERLGKTFSEFAIIVYSSERQFVGEMLPNIHDNPPRLVILDALVTSGGELPSEERQVWDIMGPAGGIRIARWIEKNLPAVPVIVYTEALWENIAQWFPLGPKTENFLFLQKPEKHDHEELLSAALNLVTDHELG